ncbi:MULTISPECIES: hypothetical protein [unclassified Cytobacillus]|uniref:hypothetical protein n=1 Tax=unclassified Cytobacillus TaxID=2675268 RepID=UPI00135B2A3E|nr:hypothetical protein [Cytobacillus sp. AMY 15.2]KAF0816294.1 hypothetical protein KIS4809_4937 [Bacillus sp. ZZV12-4809]MCM3093760.1 hypothetical protein [Cytobacillus sp. AMY 15.2]
MKTIKLSIEELIFSFYSEGLYEQGISLKETYFPALEDSELKLMLEFASRSLLAKDMAEEVDNQYKLKKEYTSFIHILNSAEKTVKASRFNQDLEGEESISFHFKEGAVFHHRLLHDHQVHLISKYPKKEVISSLLEFFNFTSSCKQSEVIFKLTNEEFEELLGDMSQLDSITESTIHKWQSKIQHSLASIFLKDITIRKGKMDSLLSLEYDTSNNPELIDIYFVIPGQAESWLIKRDQNLDLNILRLNETTINDLLLNSRVFAS